MYSGNSGNIILHVLTLSYIVFANSYLLQNEYWTSTHFDRYKFNVLPRFCVLEPEPVSVADVVELVQQDGGEEFSGTAICLQHPSHEHVHRIYVAVQLAGSVKQLENTLINRLTEWLIKWLILSLVDLMKNWLIDLFIDWFIHWLIVEVYV